jgi:hypothetical protein
VLRDNVERDDRTVLLEGTRQVARELRLFLHLHEAAVLSAAGLVRPGEPESSRVLEEIRAAHPAFITMLASDAEGRIVNTAPVQPQTRLRGSDVSDREYFRLPKAQGKPFVSGVFRGRGFGSDLLIAISAPVLGPSGEFRGVVQGSLKVDEFIKVMAESRSAAGVQWVSRGFLRSYHLCVARRGYEDPGRTSWTRPRPDPAQPARPSLCL